MNEAIARLSKLCTSRVGNDGIDLPEDEETSGRDWEICREFVL